MIGFSVVHSERTFAWLLTRRLVRDDEHPVESVTAWNDLALSRIYLQRLARLAYLLNLL